MKCTVFRSGVDGTTVRRELLALDARTPRRGAGPLEEALELLLESAAAQLGASLALVQHAPVGRLALQVCVHERPIALPPDLGADAAVSAVAGQSALAMLPDADARRVLSECSVEGTAVLVRALRRAGESRAVLALAWAAGKLPAAEVLARAVPALQLRLGRVLDRAEDLDRTLRDVTTGLFAAQHGVSMLRLQCLDPRPFALAIVNVDRFKELNDRLGHAACDTILREIGDALSAPLTDDDVVSRGHGDNFQLLLPARTADHARVLLEGMLERIRALPNPGRNVTASAGVLEIPFPDGSLWSHYYDVALRLLERAKNEGRDRVAADTWTAWIKRLETERAAEKAAQQAMQRGAFQVPKL